MKKSTLSLMVIAALAIPMAVASAMAGFDDPINKKCPLTGKDIVAGRTVEYKKQTIGFCCADCVAKFEGDPEKFIKKVKEFKKTQAE
jgi:YHS domain-containing protein